MVIFYYRYLVLFQVGAYDRVARDTQHNLDIRRMIEEYCQSENRNEMLQYRPYILPYERDFPFDDASRRR